MMCRAFLPLCAALAVVAVHGCAPTSRECDPNTILLRLKCGDQSFRGGDLVVTRQSDGKFVKDALVLTCPGDGFVFQGNVPDYKSDDVFVMKFTPSQADLSPTVKTIKAQGGCVAETIALNGTTTNGSGEGGAGGEAPGFDAGIPPLGGQGGSGGAGDGAGGIGGAGGTPIAGAGGNPVGGTGGVGPNTGGSSPMAGMGGVVPNTGGNSMMAGMGGVTPGTGGMMSVDSCMPLDTNKGGIIGPTRVWVGPSIQNAMAYKKETLGGLQVWVPAQYEGAADGKVAIMFVSGAMADPKLQLVAEKLMAAGMMPPTVMAVDGIDWAVATDASGNSAKSRAAALGVKLGEIRSKYPKIAMDPKMHAVAGQSTAGAVAFDLAWARPDLFGKVLGSSASFAPFQQWLYPYPDKVDASNKDKIRVAFDVGECDLVSSDADIPMACRNICTTQMCTCNGCGDVSWVGINKDTVTKLISLGYKAQLVIRLMGVHNIWTATIADDLAFLWRDVVCP